MTDDQVARELEGTDDALRVIGKIGKAIAVIGGVGMPSRDGRGQSIDVGR